MPPMSSRGETTRGEVLALLKQSQTPLGAYDILGLLKEKYPKIAPPTVYRALSALSDSGRVHRIESLNAYVACCDEHGHAGAVFAICGDCGTVEEREIPGVLSELSSAFKNDGFTAHRHVIEVHGTCNTCSTGSSTT